MFAMRLRSASAAAAAVCALWGAAAQAATYDIFLTGSPATGGYSSQDIGANHYDQFNMSLSGVDGNNPLTLAEGDIVNATVTFDALFTVPASVTFTSFGLYFGNSAGFPAGDVGVDGSFTFYNGASVVASNSSGTGTSGQVIHSAIFFPPFNGAFTFDSFTATFEVLDLPDTVTLDYSGFTYTRADIGGGSGGVPEPGAWVLMIAGFGGAGAMLRRRRAITA